MEKMTKEIKAQTNSKIAIEKKNFVQFWMDGQCGCVHCAKNFAAKA